MRFLISTSFLLLIAIQSATRMVVAAPAVNLIALNLDDGDQNQQPTVVNLQDEESTTTTSTSTETQTEPETTTIRNPGVIFPDADDDGWYRTKINTYIGNKMKAVWITLYVSTAAFVLFIGVFVVCLMYPSRVSHAKGHHHHHHHHQKKGMSSQSQFSSAAGGPGRDPTRRSSMTGPSVREAIFTSANTSSMLKRPSVAPGSGQLPSGNLSNTLRSSTAK